MSKILEKSIAIGIVLAIGFMIFASVVMPFFQTFYERGMGSTDSTNLKNEYCISRGSLTTCANCNATSGSGYSTFLDTCESLVARLNNTDCYSCASFGFRTYARGLGLLCLVLAIIGMGLMFRKWGK